jgi:lipoyl(octanoyl) transferase
MVLEILPVRTGGAAENMATDFLLLQRYPRDAVVRFRHYGWRAPAFTFGYAQKIAFVRAQLPAYAEASVGGTFDLCRRPTGGGIVDHRDDWTYALVIPRGHPLEERRATESYRAIHEALAAALHAQQVPAALKSATPEPDAASEGICFERAEISDVVHESTKAKIAGAAQKRNKHGLLCQGSIWKPATGGAVDWDRFHDDFAAQLATGLAVTATAVPWPEISEDEVEGLTERYTAPEWNELR